MSGEETESRCFDDIDDDGDGDGATDCTDPDCDGALGEGLCDTGALGICAEGRPVCAELAFVCRPLRSAEPEVCGDGVDQDCDGADEACPSDEDLDGDGFTVDDGDCNDQNRRIHPDAEEICDGLDNDCNGGTDEGLVSDEVCDGLDNDCDGAVDEGIEGGCLPCVALAHPECLPFELRPCGTHEGQCVEGREMCEPDGHWGGDCLGEIGPTQEEPHGLDDDCNGVADEGFWAVSEPCSGQGSAVWRVDPAATEGGDGSSWASAFATLADALSAAGPCDEVWLRSGAYLLGETVVIDEAVRLLGGFAGTETAPEERDPLTEESVIDAGGARCASRVVAVGSGPPVIFSTPSSYTRDPFAELEAPEAYDAVFGSPYGYRVRASDPDGPSADDTGLDYALLTGPPGMAIDADGFLSWRPDRTGRWTVTVAVEDGDGQSASQSFLLRVDNRAPVADAGGYRAIGEAGQVVTLDGTGSYDPDGAPVTWSWELIAVPQASEATLEDADTATPTLTTDLPGAYTVQLVVNDGERDSAPDEALVESFDGRPWASISGIGTYAFHLGDLLQLDGSSSLDPERLQLTYRWQCIERPEGSVATLSDASAARPTFPLDAFGTFWFELVVSDGTRESWPTRHSLEVVNQQPQVDLGPDRTVLVGEAQAFDASGATDPDGFPLTYQWSLYPQSGSAALLEGPHGETGLELATESVAFTPDIAGRYRVRLRAEDPGGGTATTSQSTSTSSTTTSPRRSRPRRTPSSSPACSGATRRP